MSRNTYVAKIKVICCLLASLLLIVGASSTAYATCHPSQESCSTDYGVGETQFGAANQLNACSGNQYCADLSAGELTNGDHLGTNNKVQAGGGFITNRLPSLELIVNGTNTDLGYLSPTQETMTTGTFSVKSYLASGYTVQIASDPPGNGGTHMLNTMSGPSASSPGTEQFGINLVNNTTACGSPQNIGADPVQVPDSTFSYGQAASGYDQCGKFKYNKGDVIAQSNKSSGETDYTISFLYNINVATTDGIYVYNGVIVATSTF